MTRPIRPAAVLSACCLSMLALGFAGNVSALSLVSVAGDLKFSDAESGLFLGSLAWGLVMSLVVAGPLADRFGFRVLLVASAALEVAGLVTVSFAHGLAGAVTGAVLSGLGGGVIDAVATPIVCAAYPNARSRVTNALHAFYPVGTVVIALVVLLLSHLGWSWREVYRLVAVLCIPYGIVFAMIALPAQSHEGPTRLPARRLIRMTPFILLLGCILLAGVTELGPSQWLPAYVQTAAGGGRVAGALGLILLGAMMALGRFTNSWLSHRFDPARLVCAGSSVCVVSLVLAALPFPPLVTIICLGLLGLGVSGLWPTTLALCANRFPQGGASMYSVLQAAGNFGGVIGPLTVGLVAESWCLRGGMAVLAAAPVAVIVLVKVFGRSKET